MNRLVTAADRAAARAAWIPKGAVKDPRSSELGEVYAYVSAGALYALGFRGTAGRSEFHYRFRDEARREEHVAKFFESVAAHKERMVERLAKKKAFVHSLKVGDVLRSSWGYDQTNIDYYEVTRLVGSKKVEIRAIGAMSEETGFMTGDCVPVPGSFKGEPMIKLVAEGDSVRIASYASAHKMVPAAMVAGKPIYNPSRWSSYA